MKLLLITLAAALMAAAPTRVGRARHFGGSISVLIYNNSSSASIYFDVKWYDNTTGTVYQEKTFTLANGTYYSSGSFTYSDSAPYLSVKYTTSPPQEMSFYGSTPNGGESGCHTSINGNTIYYYNVANDGYGTYEFDYNQGEGCD
jgi:hypothetical protein